MNSSLENSKHEDALPLVNPSKQKRIRLHIEICFIVHQSYTNLICSPIVAENIIVLDITYFSLHWKIAESSATKKKISSTKKEIL